MCTSQACVVVTSSISSHLSSSGSNPGIHNILFMRAIPMVIFNLVLSQIIGARLITDLKGVNPCMMGPRIVFPAFAFMCLVKSLTYIPVSTFTVIFATNPFITTILASLIYRIRISRVEIAAMVICFTCVIFVVTGKPSDPQSDVATSTTQSTLIGVGLAFVPALNYSTSGLLSFSLRPLHFTVQLFYLGLFAATLSICLGIGELLVHGRTLFLHLDSTQYFLLSVLGCSELGAMTLMTLAFTYGNPTVALFGFSSIVWAFLADAFVFHNTVCMQ